MLDHSILSGVCMRKRRCSSSKSRRFASGGLLSFPAYPCSFSLLLYFFERFTNMFHSRRLWLLWIVSLLSSVRQARRQHPFRSQPSGDQAACLIPLCPPSAGLITVSAKKTCLVEGSGCVENFSTASANSAAGPPLKCKHSGLVQWEVHGISC